jgi:hypothetical protein
MDGGKASYNKELLEVWRGQRSNGGGTGLVGKVFALHSIVTIVGI